jgi:flagellar biogenesis protein FliO
MQEHYQEDRHKGSAWKAIVPVLIIVFLIIVAIIWAAYKLIASMF